jgi:hypothetical protein
MFRAGLYARVSTNDQQAIRCRFEPYVNTPSVEAGL